MAPCLACPPTMGWRIRCSQRSTRGGREGGGGGGVGGELGSVLSPCCCSARNFTNTFLRDSMGWNVWTYAAHYSKPGTGMRDWNEPDLASAKRAL